LQKVEKLHVFTDHSIKQVSQDNHQYINWESWIDKDSYQQNDQLHKHSQLNANLQTLNFRWQQIFNQCIIYDAYKDNCTIIFTVWYNHQRKHECT